MLLYNVYGADFTRSHRAVVICMPALTHQISLFRVGVEGDSRLRGEILFIILMRHRVMGRNAFYWRCVFFNLIFFDVILRIQITQVSKHVCSIQLKTVFIN